MFKLKPRKSYVIRTHLPLLDTSGPKYQILNILEYGFEIGNWKLYTGAGDSKCKLPQKFYLFFIIKL